MRPLERVDFIAIGCGPYNLGLMALGESTRLTGVCFEERADFNWHEGMLLEAATMQTHYLYDLVTLADPTSRHSYVNYLKQNGRLQTCLNRSRAANSGKRFSVCRMSTISIDCHIWNVST
ncbi:hypothetical protein EVJ33_10850 [Exiguobacterium sp. SL-10]|nr:hypothetical protein EVJ33_10850 [Exiguobacterium sp. SL-10]